MQAGLEPRDWSSLDLSQWEDVPFELPAHTLRSNAMQPRPGRRTMCFSETRGAIRPADDHDVVRGRSRRRSSTLNPSTTAAVEDVRPRLGAQPPRFQSRRDQGLDNRPWLPSTVRYLPSHLEGGQGGRKPGAAPPRRRHLGWTSCGSGGPRRGPPRSVQRRDETAHRLRPCWSGSSRGLGPALDDRPGVSTRPRVTCAPPSP